MEKAGVSFWRSPSNIAIVKYWGKKDNQIPANPSLSFTLSRCVTETRVEYVPGKGRLRFLYDGRDKPEFIPKIERLLEKLKLGFLAELDLTIDSVNTFPHSAGIASSASAMSALVLCLTDMESNLVGLEGDFYKTASIRARLGSGSACRSLYTGAALWGTVPSVVESSDEFAIPWEDRLHSDFRDLQDWIFIVSSDTKSVSSTAGHGLMNGHPYRHGRIEQAGRNMEFLIGALAGGDWDAFISVTEEEALSLHALMMSGSPGYLLLEPQSIHLINEIRRFRLETGLPLCFTIDAGPNIHLLFPKRIEDRIRQWSEDVLPEYAAGQRIIRDGAGRGPEKIPC